MYNAFPMYNVARNNFYRREKNATVYTPPAVSDFLFALLRDKIAANAIVFDPCVGAGSLLKPFRRAGFRTFGMDIDHQGFAPTLCGNYLAATKRQMQDFLGGKPGLVLANPPFNLDAKTRALAEAQGARRPLLPEIWLQKTIALFGRAQPLALFAPYGLRLNQTQTSARWQKFVRGVYPPIASIVALPKNIYTDILFHSEVLIFNVSGLNAHYFVGENSP